MLDYEVITNRSLDLYRRDPEQAEMLKHTDQANRSQREVLAPPVPGPPAHQMSRLIVL
jgi:hypothetical protein